ncbi:hypothetical protein ACU4GD_07650 [Cupriavidus basilensis]
MRYDGQAKAQPEPVLAMLARHFDLIPVCPESLGNTPCPPRRPPRSSAAAAARAGRCRHRARCHRRRCHAALHGRRARRAGDRAAAPMQACLAQGAEPVLRQPRTLRRCSFSGAVRPGQGVAAALLAEAGVRVWNESEIEALIRTAGVLPAAMQNP